MKTISNKKQNKWANFLIITGILSFWLTIAYVARPNPMGAGGYLDFQAMFERLHLASLYNYLFIPKSSYYQASNEVFHINAVYFFINSITIVVLGILLKLKKVRAYTLVSILLFASVIIGWPFPSVFTSVFFGLMGIQYGGSLIIPMFHIAVIGSFVATIKRLRGRAVYEDQAATFPDNQNLDQQIAQPVNNLEFKKSKAVMVLAYIEMIIFAILGLPNLVITLVSRPLLLFINPILLMTTVGFLSALIAAFTKKDKTYKYAKLALIILTITFIISFGGIMLVTKELPIW